MTILSCFQQNSQSKTNQENTVEIQDILKKKILERADIYKIEEALKKQKISDSTLLFDFKLGMSPSESQKNYKKLISEKRAYAEFQCDAMDSCIVSFPINLTNYKAKGSLLSVDYDYNLLKSLSFQVMLNDEELGKIKEDSTLAEKSQLMLDAFHSELIELFTAKLGKSPYKVQSYSKNPSTYDYVWLFEGKIFKIHLFSVYDYLMNWNFGSKEGTYGVARVEYSDIEYQINYDERQKRVNEKEEQIKRQQMLKSNKF